MTLIFATRSSALARRQTQWVMQQVHTHWPEVQCREHVLTTRGDRELDRPLPEIGGKGLFTQELEAELLSGRVQAVVHSLKDLPVEYSPGLEIVAIPLREDARDALVAPRGWGLEDLPEGASVGTSSLRRSAQLLASRPDLRIESLRGNVDTRLRKVAEGQYDAVVLAGAGLSRLGLLGAVTEWLPFEVMLPAPGQGALAVQCRADDPDTLHLLSVLDDARTHLSVTAERAFLSSLGGGCVLPVAAHAVAELHGSDATVELSGLVASLDGRRVIRVRGHGSDPFDLGESLAQDALRQGAREILPLMS
jgi:hydroxymethylbilane synthase